VQVILDEEQQSHWAFPADGSDSGAEAECTRAFSPTFSHSFPLAQVPLEFAFHLKSLLSGQHGFWQAEAVTQNLGRCNLLFFCTISRIYILVFVRTL
jgi:hypothetical protein